MAEEETQNVNDAQKQEAEMQYPTTLHERTIAALSYISFLAIIPFYLKKDSKFCRFHGKQGLLVCILFFFLKPLMVLDFLNDLVSITQFGIFLWMGFAALSGRWKKMPWIYDKACELEDQLSMKTKEEEADDERLMADQVKS